MLRLGVEVRNKRHKLSIETRHYEVLFGIIYDMGKYDEEEILGKLRSISEELYSKILNKLMNGESEIRIYIAKGILENIMEKLDLHVNIPISDKYDYVLLINKE